MNIDKPISTNRFTAARYLQALSIAKGDHRGAIAFSESQPWLDKSLVVTALKSAVAAIGTADYATTSPIAENFIQCMRDFSVPLRLAGLRRVPMRTKLFVSGGGVQAVRFAEGSAIPVLAGSWTSTTLTPKKHGGIVVSTDELIKSMTATASEALQQDLAEAVAESENRSFVSPDDVGSVLYGASHFTGTGSTLAAIDADLKSVLDLCEGARAWVMTKESATFLSLVRGTGGARAYPEITVDGGTLQGLPVLTTKACAQDGSPITRVIGVLAPSQILWADEGVVRLSVSSDAMLEMSDAPTGDALAPTASGGMVSMWQEDCVGLKGIRESSFYARSGSGAYFVAGY